MHLVIGGSLGDEVALTGVLREIHRSRPRERITVAARHPEVFAGHPDLADSYPEDDGTTHVLPLDPWPLTGPLPYAYGHVLGVQVVDPTPTIELAADDFRGLREKIGGVAVDALAAGITVAIDTWAGWPRRRWPIDRFDDLARRLACERGVQVVEVGASTPDCTGAQRPAWALPDARWSLVDRLAIRETAALLSLARLYVGNDSGLAHVAAAVGTPAVVIYVVPWWGRAYPSTIPVFDPRALHSLHADAWHEFGIAEASAIGVDQVQRAALLALERAR